MATPLTRSRRPQLRFDRLYLLPELAVPEFLDGVRVVKAQAYIGWHALFGPLRAPEILDQALPVLCLREVAPVLPHQPRELRRLDGRVYDETR